MNRAVATVGLGLLLLAASASSGLSSTAPETAWSRSLGVPPLLLTYPSLIFHMPQYGATMNSQAFAIGISSSSSTSGLGAIGHLGKYSLFALSREQPRFTDSAPTPNGLQAGWATDWGAIETGLVLRGGRTEAASRREDMIDTLQVASSNKIVSESVEGALGVSWSTGETRLDLLVEVGQADAEESRQSGGPSGNIVDATTFETGVAPSVSSRLNVPLSGATDFRAVGRWSGYESTAKIANELPQGGSFNTEKPLYVDTWEAGAGVAAEHRFLGTVAFYAHYDSERIPRVTSRYEMVVSQVRTFRRGSLGVATHREFWEVVRFLAGIRHVYTYTRIEQTQTDPSRVSKVENVSEGGSDRFSWGVDLSTHHIQITGAMDANLNLLDLFFTLDVWVLF
jgi:hypothetical protein